MIPLYADTGQKGSYPVVLLILIANVAAFLHQSSLPAGQFELLIDQYAFEPAQLHHGHAGMAILSLFSSMYMHGSWGHLLGNSMYLWAFGPCLERKLGSTNMLIFYHAGGIVGSLAQFSVDPTSQIPILGASGAISALLGGYLLLFPGGKVVTLVIVVIYFTVISLPAWLLIGFWVVMQMVSGLGSIGAGTMGGVAWFAHLGGFLGGYGLLILWRLVRWIR